MGDAAQPPPSGILAQLQASCPFCWLYNPQRRLDCQPQWWLTWVLQCVCVSWRASYVRGENISSHLCKNLEPQEGSNWPRVHQQPCSRWGPGHCYLNVLWRVTVAQCPTRGDGQIDGTIWRVRGPSISRAHIQTVLCPWVFLTMASPKGIWPNLPSHLLGRFHRLWLFPFIQTSTVQFMIPTSYVIQNCSCLF